MQLAAIMAIMAIMDIMGTVSQVKNSRLECIRSAVKSGQIGMSPTINPIKFPPQIRALYS